MGPDAPDNIGHLFIALDPAWFRDAGGLEADVGVIVGTLHGSRPAHPDRPVLVAGGPEWITRQERLRLGIPVALPLCTAVREVAAFPYADESPTAEPFVLLSFIAGCTRRLGLLTNVVILPQRQTVLAAKQAAELDRLSEGRLVLGVGVGWNTAEYGAMGMPFSRRTTTLERQILLLRSLWTQPSVTVTDGQHELDHVAISPRPSRPVPIVIGGMGPLALSLIGRLADGWTVRQYLSWDVEEFEADMLERRAVIAAAAREAGRDPASI